MFELNTIAHWNKTQLLKERLVASQFYEEPDIETPYGNFKGRHIIARDTPINKGIYLGSGVREALVVDDLMDAPLHDLYTTLLQQTPNSEYSHTDQRIKAVFEMARTAIPYNPVVVGILLRHFPADDEILLGRFIELQGGQCRHQALLAAYLIERLLRDNIIHGNVSVDRNSVPYLGGHGWARYTNEHGHVTIMDLAQNYLGSLQDIHNHRWFYLRPDDHIASQDSDRQP